MLVIGSMAMRHYGLDVDRPTQDIDFISTLDEYEAVKANTSSANVVIDTESKKVLDTGRIKMEFDIAHEGNSNSDLLQILNRSEDLSYAPPHILYLLKMSHRYKKDSPHFLKTMSDIWALRHQGFDKKSVTPMDQWYRKREEETYNYSHPNLSQSKDGFFKTEGVEYVYDHDSIHRAVAIGDVPAYTKYLVGEVQCCKDKFNSLTHRERVNGVLEEAYVLSLERSLVPYNFSEDPFKVFQYALMKVCTSITSGWFREFAWENYHDCVSKYDGEYVSKFKEGLRKGEVVPFTGSVY